AIEHAVLSRGLLSIFHPGLVDVEDNTGNTALLNALSPEGFQFGDRKQIPKALPGCELFRPCEAFSIPSLPPHPHAL
ncbi:MAG TPA: hypothetical protein VI451_05410, partial [Anaerolineales bacterium]|nr:hypothetical protein [Anaerolineales bacterium]